MTTHIGQYTSYVAVIGYKATNAYVQRQMDTLLRGIVTRSYVDDLVGGRKDFSAFSRTLREVLDRLRAKTVSIRPDKSCIGFPSTRVLEKIVDAVLLELFAAAT